MNERKPYGIVVCGGESTRMQQDKSLLIYHTLPQRYHVYQLLQPYCDRVFLSCNAQQQETIAAGYEWMTDLDEYSGSGPMGALLTAFTTFPEEDFLFVGCDYPYITAATIEQLLHCREDHLAAACYHAGNGFYEPLLGWYSRRLATEVRQQFQAGNSSLQSLLRTLPAVKCLVQNERELTSIDTPEAFAAAKAGLQRGADSPE